MNTNEKKNGYPNNPSWVVDEFSEWIAKATGEVYLLSDKATGSEKERLNEKLATLKMVGEKFEQLKNE